jgi:triacylglycerol lipase
MPITDQDAIDFGFLVAYAEGMVVPNQIEPHDEPRIAAAGWDVVGHILGRDSVLPDPSALGAATPITVHLGVTVFYGYLARNQTNRGCYAVAIRGTNGFAEWVIDADFVPRGVEAWPGVKVEQGFWSVYDSMILVGLDGGQIGVKAADGVAKVVGDDGTATICGHSLGSALATYLSYDVAKLIGARASACLFASPRTGDHAWAAGYDAAVSNYRLVNYVLDVVPYVPFNAPPIQYSTLGGAAILQPATARADVRFDIACNHNLICYCAMIDYVTTRKRFDAEDAAAWRCIIGAPGFSLNAQLTRALATAVNALGGATKDIVQLISVSARAKGGHV